MKPGGGMKSGALSEWLARPPCASFLGGKSRNLIIGFFLVGFLGILKSVYGIGIVPLSEALQIRQLQ
jgi:hypothetical protein